MKHNANRHEELAREIKSRVKARSLKYARISEKTGIHSSQVSRICRGQFQKRSENVVQICTFLGIGLTDHFSYGADQHQTDVLMGLIDLVSTEETERLIKLLQEIKLILESRRHKPA